MNGRSLLARSGVVVLVFGAVWLAVLLRWRAADVVPNDIEIGLWMVALPVALLVGIALVGAGMRNAGHRQR